MQPARFGGPIYQGPAVHTRGAIGELLHQRLSGWLGPGRDHLPKRPVQHVCRDGVRRDHVHPAYQWSATWTVDNHKGHLLIVQLSSSALMSAFEAEG